MVVQKLKPFQLKKIWFSISKIIMEYQVQKQEKKIFQEHAIERDVDQILDKINREGFKSLSQKEENRLYKGSQTLSKNKKKD